MPVAALLIEQTDGADMRGRAEISAAIDVHNSAQTGRPEPAIRRAVLLRDAEGRTLGGAWCVGYWDWLHVDLLHLPQAARGQGIGTRVMRAVEREAARLGYRGVWLDTATFQAPAFYAKLGYRVFGGIGQYAPGVDRLFLLKQDPQDGPDDPGLVVSDDPTDADRAVILDGLIAFNTSAAGPEQMGRLGLLVREQADGPVVGGLWGRWSRRWLFVELLALPARLQRHRLGSELMERAEQACRDRASRGVWLDTFSFQARPFYQKRGYTQFGEIPDYPGQHRRYLLAKRLDAAPLVVIPPA